MSDQIMTAATETSAIVPEVWSKRFYDTLLSSIAFNSLVSKNYEGDIANLGDTVNIPTIPEFDVASEVTEGSRNDADAVTITSQALVINKRIAKDYIITKKALLQSIPFVDKLRELAIYSIQKKIQALIISLTVPSASSPDHQIAYDSGTTLALADLLEAKELLDDANVPMSDRHLVMDSAQMNDQEGRLAA